LLRQRRRHRRRPKVVRVLWVLVGVLVTLAGVALLVLPGPALVIIPLGLAMLALEFSWAERALEKALDQGAHARQQAAAASARSKAFAAASSALAAVAFVAAALAWDIPLLPF
jgi:uncharacterized protein (TIGR02611 family)